MEIVALIGIFAFFVVGLMFVGFWWMDKIEQE
jgi:hypothetical protein